ncbi:glutathione S-transferase family protein [Hoeflea prorocentri]|uniref:Glutathione S-transferase family protein n=1 Tax=Hoeflea prorocentri TaxID=1922333 RepID=A0A9X3UHU5_9HYPH|nr:glutathione S-transferase family protein [Hoeflea prorocentri]MCY6381617.1 glutathione S-transferase family protein [Hoeflea prorocentri]MDA5399417.1 glutathione S-transferase family protein [Hoeflea prorocentri]
MAEKLILYTNPMSRGRIARWMLEETGATYETRLLDYGTTMKADDYLKINPMGKVPAIVHGGSVVTECAAICAYLADAFPDAGLAPPADDRGAYYRWMFFAAGPLEAAIADKTMGWEVPAERERTVGYGNFAHVMDTLEQAVSGPGFIAGDRFSAADVYVGSHIIWGLQFETLERRPAFEAYAGQLADRPALKRATELDDAAMPPG